MRAPNLTTRFKKDVKRQKKRRKSRTKLLTIMEAICRDGDAPEGCFPHDLAGNWAHYRECHIEPNWLVIYAVDEDYVIFYRTGTHSDLFR